MEVNTVVISLDRLRELELAEKKANEPRSKTTVIKETWAYKFVVETDDESAEILASEIKENVEEIEQLRREISDLKEIESTIEEVKKMSFGEFRKWKRQN